MQELPSYVCASLCQVLEATAIQHLQAFPFNLHASLCQRLEATCTPHLQAPSSNLCASLCQRLEATGSTGTKHVQAVATNISAYLRQRLEATCKQTVHEGRLRAGVHAHWLGGGSGHWTGGGGAGSTGPCQFGRTTHAAHRCLLTESRIIIRRQTRRSHPGGTRPLQALHHRRPHVWQGTTPPSLWFLSI